MKSKIQQAREAVKLYKPLIRAASLKATEGDTQAAIAVLSLMAKEAGALKKLGYREDDQGRIVRRTKKWVKQNYERQKKSFYDQHSGMNIQPDYLDKMWKELEKKIYGRNVPK